MQQSELEQGEIHDVLRNDRRRLTLECLRDTETGSLSVRELSEQVAERETGESPPPRDKRQSVYVSLHQTHLPKLDELDIVEYDADAKEVTLRERAREVEVYMEVVPKYGLSWAEYYFAVGLLGLLTILGATVGVPLLSQVGVVVWATFYFLLLMGSAAYNIWTQERWLVDRIRS